VHGYRAASARISGSERRGVINATKSSDVDVHASKQMSKPEDGGQPILSGSGTKSAGQPARTESTADFSAGSIDSPQRNFTPTQTAMYVLTYAADDNGAMNLATTARCALFMGRAWTGKNLSVGWSGGAGSVAGRQGDDAPPVEFGHGNER
jgi:hypothetical protein